MDDSTKRKLLIEQLRILSLQFSTEKLTCPYKMTDFDAVESVEDLQHLHDGYLLEFIEKKEDKQTQQQLGTIKTYVSVVFGDSFTPEKFNEVWDKLYTNKSQPELALFMDCVDKEKLSALLASSADAKVVYPDFFALYQLFSSILPADSMLKFWVSSDLSWFNTGNSSTSTTPNIVPKPKPTECEKPCSCESSFRAYKPAFVEKERTDAPARARFPTFSSTSTPFCGTTHQPKTPTDDFPSSSRSQSISMHELLGSLLNI